MECLSCSKAVLCCKAASAAARLVDDRNSACACLRAFADSVVGLKVGGFLILLYSVMPFLVRCVGLAAIEVIFVCGVDDGRNPRFFLGKGAKLRHGCNCVIIVLGRNHRFRTMHGCVDPLTFGCDCALQSQTLVKAGIDLQSVVG